MISTLQVCELYQWNESLIKEVIAPELFSFIDSSKLQEFVNSRPYIDRIVIFGSRAKGNHHDNSDIDVNVIKNEESFKDSKVILFEIAHFLYDIMEMPVDIDMNMYQKKHNYTAHWHINFTPTIIFQEEFFDAKMSKRKFKEDIVDNQFYHDYAFAFTGKKVKFQESII